MNDPFFSELIQFSKEEPILYKRNEIISRPGAIDRNIYYVISGSVRAFVMANDEEQTIRFGYSGNIIVCLDSILTQRPTQFCLQTLKETKVLKIPFDVFQSFLDHYSDKNWWNRTLEHLIIQQLEREIDILTTSPAERYERVLKRSPQLFQEIPHKHIANYLRMTPETLSRLQKKS